MGGQFLRRASALVAVTFAASSVVVVAVPAPAATEGFPPAITTQLDELVQAVRGFQVPGTVLGVSVPGQGDYVGVSGSASSTDLEPITADARFRIASITKTFVATVILQLVGECRLDLDDTIAQWQPTVGDADIITVRELLQHTSGLPDYQSTATFDDEFQSHPFRIWNHQELVSLIAGQPPAFTPGTSWKYSNTNYLLLGLIAEAVTGQPLERLVTDRIIDPLGLEATSFPTTSEIPVPATGGTDLVDDEHDPPNLISATPTDYSPSGLWAAGAMISNLHDLSIWARVLATGALLTPALQHERFAWVPTGVTFPSAQAPPPLFPVSYGLGVMAAGQFVGHNGEIPGYESIMLYDPGTGTTIVELENATVSIGIPRHPATDEDVPLPDDVMARVAAILGQAPGAPPEVPDGVPPACTAPVAMVPTFTG
jgi:D-alanyl-D-alanine carboxypeptidase